MRFSAFVGVCAAVLVPIVPTFAQGDPVAATSIPATALPIPLPPNAAVQTELNTQDQDILGMAKSFLNGMADKKTGDAKAAASADAGPMAAVMSLLTDGQLTTLLKDIHHLHVVAFKSDAAEPRAVAHRGCAVLRPRAHRRPGCRRSSRLRSPTG